MRRRWQAKTSGGTARSAADRWRIGSRGTSAGAEPGHGDEALKTLSLKSGEIHGNDGRPSVAPGRLLRALLLRMLYMVRSERMLIRQVDGNLWFRWFAGWGIDEPARNHAVFSNNGGRLLNEELAREFFGLVLERAQATGPPAASWTPAIRNRLPLQFRVRYALGFEP
jgi:hypothetical protein